MQVLYVERKKRKYGFWRFLLDVVLVLLSHGLWLIWIYVRENRR